MAACLAVAVCRGCLGDVGRYGVAGFAHSTALLLSARAVQGLGAALAVPAALALLSAMYRQERQRQRALGDLSAAMDISMVVGLVVGGLSPRLWAGRGACSSSYRSASSRPGSLQQRCPRAGIRQHLDSTCSERRWLRPDSGRWRSGSHGSTSSV
ncbi:MFS transporter [Kribbella capetownensis]|uniref:MFS transporter n=1 Tax=Kribbella capetownensis TaxID=1572659 RepID=A0A4R0IU54_9ACTN|nr:MFS transporter [Kribbella capetownensis]